MGYSKAARWKISKIWPKSPERVVAVKTEEKLPLLEGSPNYQHKGEWIDSFFIYTKLHMADNPELCPHGTGR